MKNIICNKWSILLLSAIIVGGCGTTSEETVETDTPATEEAAATENQETEASTSDETATDTETETPAAEEPAESENNPGISKAEFDQIENGMTYEEVVQIIGGEGEVLSEVGEKGTELYTVMYTYDGETGLGANANFTFQNNKLQAKAQFGLE